MAALTFVDAVGAARAWINSRTTTLVGGSNPLAKGAHLRELDGPGDKCYAYLNLQTGGGADGGAEGGWMRARIAAEVNGPTLEAVTKASMALADEIVNGLITPTVVTVNGEQVIIQQVDELSGPFDFNDFSDLPRHVIDFTLILMPYAP
jgi:hypothetical protein